MKRYLPLNIILPLLCLSPAAAQPRFEISFAASAHAGPITGRVFVALSKTEAPEPIQQIGSWTGQPCRLREWIGKAPTRVYGCGGPLS